MWFERTVSDPVLSLAQGFTTSSGTANTLVETVTLGLFSDDTRSARTLSIHPNIGSGTSARPGASPLYTSDSQAVTLSGPSMFSFTNAQLSPSTSYSVSIATVPEPSTYAMVPAGLACAGAS